jgi:hypothetical protein
MINLKHERERERVSVLLFNPQYPKHSKHHYYFERKFMIMRRIWSNYSPQNGPYA